MSDDVLHDEDGQDAAAAQAGELAANAREEMPVDPEDLDYDDAELGVDEPCGEGMCQCSCGGGCVCGCECSGDGEWKPGECDHCYGETIVGPLGPIYCACAIGQGAGWEECRCGPPPGHVPADEPATYTLATPAAGGAG
ncbi:hypothetical protein [Streptomyces sp. NPDC087856]|uniref:hypothetical protein n=1 Tax=Streptomyces sp. NPDC087856 TaxID=3365811 RepID=UPI003821E6C2